MRASKAVSALLFLACVQFFPQFSILADPPPVLNGLSASNSQKTATWTPYPAAQQYLIQSSTNPSGPFVNDASGGINGYAWTGTNNAPSLFYRLQVTPVSSNALWAINLLNRAAYGPSPDELARVVTGTNAIGPAAFLNEQLNPASITEDTSYHTNIAFIGAKLPEVTNVINPQFVTNIFFTTNGSIITTNVVVTTNTVWAGLSDLRAWHILRGVGAKRQLLEILLQFFENHFVTEYTKTLNYMDGFGLDSNVAAWVSTQFEYLENERWRNALLDPSCTFSNLVRISAESPAMIIYLDTVLSKGSGNQIANENYARELMELFTMGVNNGYDQNDITVMSRCWTGWSVQKVDVTNAFNPFATPVKNVLTNDGAWVLNYRQGNHYTNAAKVIYPGKTVPARFGAPWAGRNYELDVPIITGTNGMSEGYMVINHLCNLPFTEEFISVKFCNLFVHDGFAIGYDFTDPNLSPEGQLVKSCMLTWENSNPKGQIWLVLSNIFNSDLFKGNGSSMQKVKTPLEYTISAIRALRTSTNGSNLPGTFTSDTDGYSIGGVNGSSSFPLNRMGGMLLFNRQDPNGYPEDAAGWISAGTLAERIRWMQTYLMASNDGNKGDGISGGNKSVSNPVLLLQLRLPQQNPSGSLLNAGDVADFFLSILFPAEGKANRDLYRTAAINYLNDGSADGTAPPYPPFSALFVNSPTYDLRVRGMVAMLMGFQRFEEQ